MISAIIAGVLLAGLYLVVGAYSREKECQYEARHNQQEAGYHTIVSYGAPTAAPQVKTQERPDHKQTYPCNSDGGFGSFILSRIRLFARFLRRYSELVTALFTAVLTVATILLWRATNDLWDAAEKQGEDIKRQIKATEDFAAAAKKSADVAESAQKVLERPYIYLGDIFAFNDERKVTISIANYGRTPAIVKEVEANFFIAKTRPKFPYPDPEGKATVFRDFFVLATNSDPKTFAYVLKPEFALENVPDDLLYLRPVLAEKEFGYLTVTVTYDDVQGQTHHAGTCWIFHRNGSYFVRHPAPECHYQN